MMHAGLVVGQMGDERVRRALCSGPFAIWDEIADTPEVKVTCPDCLWLVKDLPPKPNTDDLLLAQIEVRRHDAAFMERLRERLRSDDGVAELGERFVPFVGTIPVLTDVDQSLFAHVVHAMGIGQPTACGGMIVGDRVRHNNYSRNPKVTCVECLRVTTERAVVDDFHLDLNGRLSSLEGAFGRACALIEALEADVAQLKSAPTTSNLSTDQWWKAQR